MPRYVAALTIVLLMGLVVSRVALLRRLGIRAMHVGKQDRSDFLLPPFALFYFYLVFANAFGWPSVSGQRFFDSEPLAWLGVALCAAGLALFLWSLISFGRSFRVGIDTETPGTLVTSGAFARTRNPIYVAFATILLGQFLIFPNWLLLLYLGAAVLLFHRQVLREESYLRSHYGREFDAYATRVRRYV